MLTPRQELVLRKVVEEYVRTGEPVGSKSLAAQLEWSPSTIRHELAVLEELALLAHPHTSAGRIPTDSGYRYFVDRLLPEPQGHTLDLSLMRREVDEALRSTSATLSRVTNLLAIVSAPPLPARERTFLASLSPVFTDLAEAAESSLYVDGAAQLLRQGGFEVSQLNDLMEMLERRVSLLEVLRQALSAREELYVRIGRENELPALRSLALVAAGYGLPERQLGTVSVIGPVSMDYGVAIRSVREAAFALSRYVEDVYDE
jgi:transcriptional regulator of heat shock response